MHLELPCGAIFDSIQMRSTIAGLADQRGKIARMLESGELISRRGGSS